MLAALLISLGKASSAEEAVAVMRWVVSVCACELCGLYLQATPSMAGPMLSAVAVCSLSWRPLVVTLWKVTDSLA